MRLLSPDQISEFTLRTSRDKYVSQLAMLQPVGLASNARGTALVLEADGKLLPIVLSDGIGGDASVCSIQAHYVESPLKQLSSMANRFSSALAKPFLVFLGSIIRAGNLGRTVYVNEWLLSTNLEAELEECEISKIRSFLASRFPDRAIVFRSVDKSTRAGLYLSLLKNDFRFVRSRRIYVFDPTRPDFSIKKNLSSDLRLLRNWPGSLSADPLNDQALRRVSILYKQLYLRKYRSGNTDFTDSFFKAAFGSGLFEYRCLFHQGELLAFTAWRLESSSMLGTLVGYDLNKPQKMGLYRLAFAIDFKEAIDRQIPYHVSSGAGHFKRLRGAQPVTEYDAVFDRHLSSRSRYCWAVFRLLMRIAEKIEGDSIDFKKAPAG